MKLIGPRLLIAVLAIAAFPNGNAFKFRPSIGPADSEESVEIYRFVDYGF